MMIHEKTQMELERIRQMEPQNVILYGPSGLGKKECALELAAEYLHTSPEELKMHPDYLYLSPLDGCIRAEQAEAIRAKANYLATQKTVCIIEEAQTMTADMQNKLLKLLEDAEKRFVVLFVASGPLLKTISSRCITVAFHPLTAKEFYCHLKQQGEVENTAFLAANGCPGIYKRLIQDKTAYEYLDGFYQCFCQMKERRQMRQILKLLHAYKERDDQYLPDIMEMWQMQCFFQLFEVTFANIIFMKMDLGTGCGFRAYHLAKLYTGEEAYRIYQKAQKAAVHCMQKGKYNKNDFFSFLMELIPLGEAEV